MPELRTKVSSHCGVCEPNHRSQRASGLCSTGGDDRGSAFLLCLACLRGCSPDASAICLHPARFLTAQRSHGGCWRCGRRCHARKRSCAHSRGRSLERRSEALVACMTIGRALFFAVKSDVTSSNSVVGVRLRYSLLLLLLLVIGVLGGELLLHGRELLLHRSELLVHEHAESCAGSRAGDDRLLSSVLCCSTLRLECQTLLCPLDTEHRVFAGGGFEMLCEVRDGLFRRECVGGSAGSRIGGR